MKDTILNHGAIFDAPINKGPLESVKLAKQRYNHDLENKTQRSRSRKVTNACKKGRRKRNLKKSTTRASGTSF